MRYGVEFVVLSCGFMRILGAELCAQISPPSISHPSFLPLYKGAHAIADSYAGAGTV